MTLDHYITICSDAITANFRVRNTLVFVEPKRQQRLQKSRRDTVRGWVAELRRAQNPETAKEVARDVLWKVA